MWLAYEYHEAEVPNVAACVECHGDVANFDIGGTQTEVLAMIATLKQLLIDAGIYNEATDLANTGTYDVGVAGAYYNYWVVVEDNSKGVHNPSYIKALLQAGIDALQ